MKRSLLVGLLLFVSLVLVGCSFISFTESSRRDLAISGFVLDEDGEGVGGVVIEISPGGQAITNAEGVWEFGLARKGSKVSAEKSGFAFSSEAVVVTKTDQVISFLAIAITEEEEEDPAALIVAR